MSDSSVPKEQTKYFSIDNTTAELNYSEKDAFSILCLNIRRKLNKNFENLKTSFASLNPGVLLIPTTKISMDW